MLVLTQDSFLYEKSGEAVKLFLKAPVVLRGELRDEALGGIRRIARIEAPVFHVGHTLVELLFGDVECRAEIERVEWLYVAWNEHDVVRRLVEYDKFAVAVIDKAA